MSDVLQGTNKNNKFVVSLTALIILLGTGFLNEMVGCSSFRMLTNNMYVKHILLIAVIYVAIDVNKDNNISPFNNLKDVFMLYIYYLIVTKLDKNFTIGVFILLGLLYVLNSFNIYYKLNNMKDKENKSSAFKKILEIFLIFITIIGFVIYLIKQLNEHKNFNIGTFMLGVIDCKNK